jgi:leader peptidase (prepilin peptidase)/N-methyltransferase
MAAANWFLHLILFEILIAACFTSILYDTWVPLVLVRPGIGLGIFANVFIPGFGAHLIRSLPAVIDRALASIAGAVAGYVLLAAIRYLYFRVRNEEGLGRAVAHLAAMIGAFGGLRVFLVTLLLSSLLGSAASLPLIQVRSTWKGSDWKRMQEPLPYSLFLAATAILTMYIGEPLVRAYLRLF